MNLVLFIPIGLIAGALAGRVVSGHGYGVLGDIVVGVIGAFLGGWIFSTFLGVAGGGISMSLLVAFIGAIALLWLIRLVAPRRA
ncbi:MAG: GlsB/YeaQ/YmgE family stress response membrane protein [Candidatus Rokubacteria bacterium]|nr:GlsB/YeaQ/YmgE family stress response membrane protein [Candidatus Rokubacteria bacterium]